MIYRSGRAEKEMQKQKILVSISFINILFVLLSFAIPSVIGLPSTEIEIIIYRLYVLLIGLFVRFPYFITYGIMMYRYGKRNRDLLSKYYMVSIWILLLCNGYFVINISFPVFGVFTSSQFVFFGVYFVLTYIFLLVYIVGWVFLALHGKIAGNINFMYAGILGCSLVVLNIIFFMNRGMYITF